MKKWLEEYKYDKDSIYFGLNQDLIYYLKKIMDKKDIDNRQLAEKLGVSTSYINKIFSGQINISLKTVSKILSAIKVDARIILIDAEEENKK